MAIPWLTALKVVPWGDVIEHAPNVLKAARKLMDRQKAEPELNTNTAVDMPGQSVPSLGELQNRLIAAQVQMEGQAQTQVQLTETLAALAEQNAQLVQRVETNRVRVRWLTLAVLLLGLGLAALWALGR